MNKQGIKKGFEVCISSLILVAVLSLTAFADTATRVEAGPRLKLHKWVKTDTYSLTPGGGNPKGSKCYTFFSNYGSLPSTCEAWDQRDMEIFLMEDDVIGDDCVKSYVSEFTGRKLTSIGFGGTNTPGEIEDTGTAEMYLDCKVYKRINGSDPEDGYVIGKLFDFQIGINS